MKIEIGAGKKPREGYATCDIRDLETVDYVCAADKLPFENNTIEEVYSRHVVEHFTLKEILKVFKEWNRVLKRDGVIYIICPNLTWHLKQVLEGTHESFYEKSSGKNARYWGFGSLFGWQQDEFDVHKFGYYFNLLKDILEDLGFDQVEDLTDSGNGLENEPWHLEVRAKKRTDSKELEQSIFYTHFDVSH